MQVGSTEPSYKLCVYIYIYMYMHVYIYIYMYMYMCVCVYVLQRPQHLALNALNTNPKKRSHELDKKSRSQTFSSN